MEQNTKKKMDWKKYVSAFIITSVIFGTAIFLGNYFNNRKINEVKNVESKIAVDILASETQYALLSESSCKDIETSTLSQELNSLDERLNYLESKFGANSEEFINLKKYYSVLEIKDYLLLKKIGAKCKTAPTAILYFYSNDCSDCTREGYVLSRLRESRPDIRVYSFDLSLELPVIKTLAKINEVAIDKLPAIIIKDKILSGFQSVDSLAKFFPEIKKATTTSATSTKK